MESLYNTKKVNVNKGGNCMENDHNKKMTQSEFIKSYCEASNITERKLNELGSFAIICECGSEECRGWVMMSKENLRHHVNFNLHYCNAEVWPL